MYENRGFEMEDVGIHTCKHQAAGRTATEAEGVELDKRRPKAGVRRVRPPSSEAGGIVFGEAMRMHRYFL